MRHSENLSYVIQKQPSRGVLAKQLYWNHTSVCGCLPVTLLHIFRTPFTKNTSERLLLVIWMSFVRLIYVLYAEGKVNFNKVAQSVFSAKCQQLLDQMIRVCKLSSPLQSFSVNVNKSVVMHQYAHSHLLRNL